MPYNLDLAEQIRGEVKHIPGIVEKKMFGGVGFMLHGNMAVGVHKDALVVRVSPDDFPALLLQPHTRPFDITGKPMSGWLLVDPPGYSQPSVLHAWIGRGLAFARSLPPK